MMLDTRGGMRLDEQTLDDLLLRATGRGRLASGIENGLYPPVIRLLLLVHLDNAIP